MGENGKEKDKEEIEVHRRGPVECKSDKGERESECGDVSGNRSCDLIGFPID